MVYLIHERLSSATASWLFATTHVRMSSGIMWIFLFSFCSIRMHRMLGRGARALPSWCHPRPGRSDNVKAREYCYGRFHDDSSTNVFDILWLERNFVRGARAHGVAHGVGVGEATCCHRYFDAARESAAGAALGAPARPPLPLLPRPLPFPRPRPRPTPAAAAGSCCGAYGIPTTAVVVKVPVAQSPPCCILLQPYSCYVAVGASLNSRHSQHGP